MVCWVHHSNDSADPWSVVDVPADTEATSHQQSPVVGVVSAVAALALTVTDPPSRCGADGGSEAALSYVSGQGSGVSFGSLPLRDGEIVEFLQNLDLQGAVDVASSNLEAVVTK